jgi:hypothetical protein
MSSEFESDHIVPPALPSRFVLNFQREVSHHGTPVTPYPSASHHAERILHERRGGGRRVRRVRGVGGGGDAGRSPSRGCERGTQRASRAYGARFPLLRRAPRPSPAPPVHLASPRRPPRAEAR